MAECNLCLNTIRDEDFFTLGDDLFEGSVSPVNSNENISLYELVQFIAKLYEGHSNVKFLRKESEPIYFCNFCMNCYRITTSFNQVKKSVDSHDDMKDIWNSDDDEFAEKDKKVEKKEQKEKEVEVMLDGRLVILRKKEMGKEEEDEEEDKDWNEEMGKEEEKEDEEEEKGWKEEEEDNEEEDKEKEKEEEKEEKEEKEKEEEKKKEEKKVEVIGCWLRGKGMKQEEEKLMVFHPVGSFNRKKWQTILRYNGSEGKMWSHFIRDKKFNKELNKLVDKKCYESAIPDYHSLFRFLMNKYMFVLNEEEIHDYTQEIITLSHKRAFTHANGVLMYQDLITSNSCPEDNVYTRYLINTFNGSNMGHTSLDMMEILTQLYYTSETFSAWRVTFHVVWRHIVSFTEKKCILNLLLRRIPYNGYTSVIYSYIAREMDVFSLYNPKKMNEKVREVKKMQIYNYNYRMIKDAYTKGLLPNIQYKRNTRRFYRSPVYYEPSFYHICFQMRPIMCP